MKPTLIAFILAVMAAFPTACAAPNPATIPTAAPASSAAAIAPTTTPARLRTLHFELPTDPNMSDLPRLMAADALRAQGYTVEAVDLNDNTLSVQALEQGHLDLAYIGNGITWTAIQRGASIKTILDDTTDLRVLAVLPGITKCADLDGKQVAVPGTNTTQALLVNTFIKSTCPDAEIQLVVMSNANNRFIAMAAGQVDAATMSLTEALGFEITNDTKVTLLDEYSGRYQQLRGAGQVMRRELIEKYPETAKDIVRALLTTRREVQDLDVLIANAVKYLKMDPEDARTLGKIYLERKIWNPNGGWSPENLQENLDFLEETGGVPEGLTIQDIADLSIVNAVLDEIGRQ